MKAHSLVADGSETELAFFGGSFTAIEPQRLDALLAAGRKYIDSGIVSGIRISTRPDCIDPNMLEKLARAGVTDIELGIQSTDDAAAGIPHGTAKTPARWSESTAFRSSAR